MIHPVDWLIPGAITAEESSCGMVLHGDYRMNNNSSPLEHLAAFAITFALGMVATAALGAYARFVKSSQKPVRQSERDAG